MYGQLFLSQKACSEILEVDDHIHINHCKDEN